MLLVCSKTESFSQIHLLGGKVALAILSFVYYHMVRYIILCTMYTEFVGTNISDPFLIYEVGSGSKTRVIYSSYT